MQIADEWGPWVNLRPDRPFPFRIGDYVRIRTFISCKPYLNAEGFVTEDVIPNYVMAVACLRPWLDRIEVSVRRPRGMRILTDLLENLPVKVVHE